MTIREILATAAAAILGFGGTLGLTLIDYRYGLAWVVFWAFIFAFSMYHSLEENNDHP